MMDGPQALVRRATVSLALLAAACAPPGPTRQEAMQSLVGASELTLAQQMGVPTRSFEAAGSRFLAYDDRRIAVTPAYPSPVWWGPGPVWFGGTPFAYETGCETTFELTDGVVRGFTLRGAGC